MNFNITIPILKSFAKKFIAKAEESAKQQIEYVAAEIEHNGTLTAFLFSANDIEILPTSGKRSISKLEQNEVNKFIDIFRLNGFKNFTFDNSMIMTFTFSLNSVNFKIEDVNTDEEIFNNTIKFNN